MAQERGFAQSPPAVNDPKTRFMRPPIAKRFQFLFPVPEDTSITIPVRMILHGIIIAMQPEESSTRIGGIVPGPGQGTSATRLHASCARSHANLFHRHTRRQRQRHIRCPQIRPVADRGALLSVRSPATLIMSGRERAGRSGQLPPSPQGLWRGKLESRPTGPNTRARKVGRVSSTPRRSSDEAWTCPRPP